MHCDSCSLSRAATHQLRPLYHYAHLGSRVKQHAFTVLRAPVHRSLDIALTCELAGVIAR